MARIYSNECFSLPVVEALRKLGHDVVTTFDRGLANSSVSDEEVLRYATEESRILITFNRKHFIRLHHRQSGHAGIVVCTEDRSVAELSERIHGELNRQANMHGLLIRVNRPGK